MPKLDFLHSLSNRIFLRLYAAQTVSLLGDTLTWVGLALLAFNLAGDQAAIVLSVALTLRVLTFVVVSPLVGAIADRFDRKLILAIAHFARMIVVALLPWVTAVWQLYGLMIALNIFNALFTPTYKATIPLVTSKADYPQAIALSSATGQLLGVLGPGMAGGLAAWVGIRQIFLLDALSFWIAALLIITLPNQIRAADRAESWRLTDTWQDMQAGTRLLFRQAPLRYALGVQLVAAIAGAQILVNTVSYVEGELHLSSVHYGWVMAAFGIGATLAALIFGAYGQKQSYLSFLGLGGILITVALLPANYVGWLPLLGLWLLAGMGESWINVPTQTLIADLIPTEWQGRVYGAHFAWSHLWWAIAYPLAGWLGRYSQGWFGDQAHSHAFLSGGLIGLGVLVLVHLSLLPQQAAAQTLKETDTVTAKLRHP
ncbi:MAG: MFS transporter [Aphanocapsa sp. GSE-SYN-MK-11-07L]|jgi:NRE family putative nickel resistance protein-like MFS transporter|nr:MFS transporter [Aphanocapsa sp. GSE-SYN-MK-11-07L]